ncbi:MAG TPA: hypothetical protein VJV05_06520 [Pyrinomonadaceae bacterium]|nr:hypothetical protein [Pyrinomonadaceae bacterium]
MFHWKLVLLCLLTVCVCAGSAGAQSPSPTPVVHKEIKRWFDFETLTAATRYRYTEADSGVSTSALQYQVVARWRFKFDSKGKYSVVGQLATGSNIQSGWNLTGWGTGDFQGDFPVKQLYFEAKPIKQLEVQIGGIAPHNGENTEITGYDNDAYLMGERVRIKYPKKLWFDEISATNAFVGDITKPNVFRRFEGLGEWNYHQILLQKKINKHVSFSADYTYEAGIDTLRQGLKLTVPELKVVDTVRFENYQRIDPNPGYGFALQGEKKATKKLNFIAGISDINHTMLNGDRFPRGTRLFFHAAYKITPELSVGPVIIQAVGPLDGPSLPRTRFEFIASYNVLDALRHYKIF